MEPLLLISTLICMLYDVFLLVGRHSLCDGGTALITTVPIFVMSMTCLLLGIAGVLGHCFRSLPFPCVTRLTYLKASGP
jgi:hypothetical protein